MRYLNFIFLSTLMAISLNAQKTSVQDIEPKVEALLAKMTLDEKIGQLNQVDSDISTGTAVMGKDVLKEIREGRVGSILNHRMFENKRTIQEIAVRESRLGIPIIFGFDVIHGYKTIFPIPLAQAATWDLAAIEQADRIGAEEATADGQHWTFAPMVDVSRDPRWGRVMEGGGEDPFLGSKIAEARVRGFQGNDLSAPNTLAACAKHFAAYGFVEGGREYNTVDMSEQKLREIVLPPFEAAAKAGCATFMNAFNTLNGIPASMHHQLINGILRGEWGWQGMIVSDWNSFGETIIHGAASDDADAAAKCLSAGSDMDMVGGTFQRGLKKALDKGMITQAQIDEAVRRVLRLKFALGLFDDPFRYFDSRRHAETLEKPEFRKFSREFAAKSMVLLKNDGSLLPLQGVGTFKKIALIGPFVDSRARKDYMSFWTLGLGNPQYDTTLVVTPAQALKPALEKLGYEVTITEICLDADCDEKAYSAALQAARAADLVIACVGEHGDECGESRSRTSLDLPYGQDKLLQIVSRGNKPTLAVLFNGRPLAFSKVLENIPAVLVAWQPGFEAGNALADVITGAVNPGAKLPMTFPKSTGQIPIYYNQLNTGRPQVDFGQMWTSGYLDSKTDPAFPFGHGLSYTTFSYSGLQVSASKVKIGQPFEIRVTVTNTGEVSGEEVVQLYLHDVAAAISRPIKELKGFEKIALKPRESKTVTFRLTSRDLEYWAPKNGDTSTSAIHQLERRTDPGLFKVYVGGSSHTSVETEFILE